MRAAEALLFEASVPVPSGTILDAYTRVTGEDVGVEEVEAAIEQLGQRLRARGSALEVRRWGGGYRLVTHPDVAPFIEASRPEARPRKLSASLLETVAILAYRQPATKPELDFVRGVDTDYSLRKLLELGFVDVVGRGEGVGRPLLYGTTQRFLEAFGLDTLADLPTLREVEEILADPAFNHERARLLALDPRPALAPSSSPDPT